jgi:hypothetical protein
MSLQQVLEGRGWVSTQLVRELRNYMLEQLGCSRILGPPRPFSVVQYEHVLLLLLLMGASKCGE